MPTSMSKPGEVSKPKLNILTLESMEIAIWTRAKSWLPLRTTLASVPRKEEPMKMIWLPISYSFHLLSYLYDSRFKMDLLLLLWMLVSYNFTSLESSILGSLIWNVTLPLWIMLSCWLGMERMSLPSGERLLTGSSRTPGELIGERVVTSVSTRVPESVVSTMLSLLLSCNQ
jgi:hypothetical protein